VATAASPGSPDRTHGARRSLQGPDFHAPSSERAEVVRRTLLLSRGGRRSSLRCGRRPGWWTGTPCRAATFTETNPSNSEPLPCGPSRMLAPNARKNPSRIGKLSSLLFLRASCGNEGRAARDACPSCDAEARPRSMPRCCFLQGGCIEGSLLRRPGRCADRPGGPRVIEGTSMPQVSNRRWRAGTPAPRALDGGRRG
jgi:hypothetical protein